MGFFDNPACFDWNGDGKIDSWDAGIELGVVNSIAEDLDREDRISRMQRAIVDSGMHDISDAEFQQLCDQTGLSKRSFTQSDLDELQRRLNR